MGVEKRKRRRGHVLAVPFPAQGHVTPLLQLSRLIASHGVRVTFVNTHFIHDKITRAANGGHAYCGDDDDDVVLTSISDGLAGDDDRSDAFKLWGSLKSTMAGNLTELIGEINGSNSDERISCVIADVTLGCVLEVAASFGAESVGFTPASMAMTLQIPNLIQRGNLDLNGAATDATGDGDVIVGQNGWDAARATFYGPPDAGEGMGAACGYKNVFQQGYGQETTALSTALFNDGAACGACFEIMCANAPQACKRGAVICVTATNFCPPDYSKTTDIWCNPPQKHFDLARPMFEKIAEYKAGVVPVVYRRVKCGKSGGVKFEMGGNNFFTLVLVYNVAGVGDVTSVKVKSSSSDWTQMTCNWGQNWQTGQSLQGQSLSFQVTTSDGTMVQEIDVVPSNWGIGMTYEGKANFR